VLLDSLDDHLGGPWEEAFREHLRRLATTGGLGRGVVAIGPFWGADGQDEIDAVVLAGRDRHPVLVGEAEWARSVDGRRLTATLRENARALPGLSGSTSAAAPTSTGASTSAGTPVRLALCAREEIHNAPDDALVVTAADIFGVDR
jgi:hypothetical protein